MLRPEFPSTSEDDLPIAADGVDLTALEEQVQQGLEIVTALEDLNAITSDESIALESIFLQVATEGISKDDFKTIEAIAPGTLSGLNPNRLTTARSTEGVQVALEAIDWRKAGIIAVIVAAVAGLLAKLISWLSSKAKKEPKAKMAERVAKTVDKIYERQNLHEISESFNRKNPYKGGTHEFALYESLMQANHKEKFDELYYIEVIALAVCEYQIKVKRKRFDDKLAHRNMDYLINACRYAFDNASLDSKQFARVVKSITGNFLANNAYNAYEDYIVTTPPRESIYSRQGVEVILAQYDFFFLIADHYRKLMEDFTITVASVVLDEEITKLNYDSNAKRYKLRVRRYFDDLARMPPPKRNRFEALTYTRLENKLFDIWEEFRAKPHIVELNKLMGISRSSAQWLFDYNQLIAQGDMVRPSRQGFASRARNEQNVSTRDIMLVKPAPSGMSADITSHIYAVSDSLKALNAKGAVHGGTLFNFSDYMSESEIKHVTSTGADRAGHLYKLYLYGVREDDSQLQDAREAIIRINGILHDDDYAGRLDRVADSMRECSAMFDDWKQEFGEPFKYFIEATGPYSNEAPLASMGESPIRRGRINIQVTMNAIFNSIRATSGVLADHTNYLNGIEQHVMTALQKRAKAADAWKSLENSKVLRNIGKKT